MCSRTLSATPKAHFKTRYNLYINTLLPQNILDQFQKDVGSHFGDLSYL